jgi:preprotein translocase subunit SecA
MNKQREVIYGQRREILEGVSLKEDILAAVDKILEGIIAEYISDELASQEWDLTGFINAVKLKFGLEWDKSIIEAKDKHRLQEDLYQHLVNAYETKEESIGQDLMRHLERMVFLQIIDSKWKDHLYAMDNLREGIGLRAYGQRDPLIEYKREAFEMFSQMISGIEEEAAEAIFRLQAARPKEFRGVFSSLSQEFLHPETSRFEKPEAEPAIEPAHRFGLPQPVSVPPTKKAHPKVGRNDPCPCGKIDPITGRPLKYKKCCGK